MAEPTGDANATETLSGPIFIAGENDTLNLGSGDYNPGDLIAIDTAIRHMTVVVDHLKEKANECVGLTGSSNFEVVTQNRPDTTRARSYVCPANNEGIHEELSDSVLLKAAINMGGR